MRRHIKNIFTKLFVLRMKLLVFLVFVALNSFSQKNVKEFYDSNWQSVDSSNATYYRLVSYDKNKKSIGKTRDYYLSGQLQFKGKIISFESEIKTGKCIWYYENGKKNSFVHYNKEGELDGKVKCFYQTGKKQSVGRFVKSNSEKQGLWKNYHENGKLEHKGHYKKGKRKGVHKYWYSNGKIRAINYSSLESSIIYWTEKGEKKILILDYEAITSYWNNANQLMNISRNATLIKETYTIVHNDPFVTSSFETKTYVDYGLTEGENKIFDIEGRLKFHFFLKDDLMEGVFLSYYGNGNVAIEVKFHKNIYEGEAIIYDEDGQIYRINNYHKGQLDDNSKICPDKPYEEQH
jgi:antitoxin component YwqK of YwqJK toxin-antitoxin module